MYIKSSSNVPEVKCYESLWNRLRNSVLTSIMGDNTQFIQIHQENNTLLQLIQLIETTREARLA